MPIAAAMIGRRAGIRGLRPLHDLAWLVGSALGFGCGNETPATFVEPVFEDPCKFLECPATGVCATEDDSEIASCFCNIGYVGESCERCEPGFHRDAFERCISDRTCAEHDENPCGDHGTCSDANGVIECACDRGYEGPRCTLCAHQYARDKLSRCAPLVSASNDGGSRATDAGMMQDGATARDAGTLESGMMEGGASEGGATEGGARDAEAPEGGTIDSGALDAEAPEAGTIDSATPEAGGSESGTPDTDAPDGATDDAGSTCEPSTCAPHATCSVVGGRARCDCYPGYSGPQCTPCGTEISVTETFDASPGWPTRLNTCVTRSSLELPGLSLHSRHGDGTVQLCAPSTINGLSTPHIEVEAGPGLHADLRFTAAAHLVSFTYAARLDPLSLDVLADGSPVRTIELPGKSSGTLVLELDRPATVISLRSRSQYMQNVGLDDIVHHSRRCQ